MGTELEAMETLLEANGLPRNKATSDKVRKHLAGISALVDFGWQTVHQDLAQLVMPPKWTQWTDEFLLPLMYWQEQLHRPRYPGQKAQSALVLQTVEEAFARHPCTLQWPAEVLEGWKAWAGEHARAFPRASSAVEGRNGYLAQMPPNHRGLPCDAIRGGRGCTMSMVGLRTGRHRRRGFAGGCFPICSRGCGHRSTRCLCQGNGVSPSR